MDLDGLLACRRMSDAGRERRCASATPRQISSPTAGARVLNFGERTQFGSASKGVVFEASGPTVIAPTAGRVLFAGAFRSYGNLVIIDSCAVDVLVGGMADVTTEAGVLVEGGQSIGIATPAGRVIYLEVRKANRPIDPFGSLSD